MEDFNTKVNAIIDRINTLKTDAKVYDSTYGIWVRTSGVILSKLLNERLDKLNISYDMESFSYRYLIARLLDYEDELEIDNEGIIGEKVQTNDLRYINYYHFDNATYNHIESFANKGNNIQISEFATQILDNYLVDIVVSKFSEIVDVDMLNNQIKEFLIADYIAYIDRRFIRDEEEFKAEMEKNNITDISSLTTAEIDRIFGSYSVAETINSYHDIAPDMYVYLPTKQLFGIDPVVNKEKTYINGKQTNFNKGVYKYPLKIKSDMNANNGTEDEIEKNDYDETPPTGDTTSILLMQLIMSLSFIGCIMLFIRRKQHV